jgi:DNA (cytosine-5)-methyltransferase 1
MRVGSTFSGVGGLDLGLARAGHAVAFQVEHNPYRSAVLERHWPDVPRFEDVRDFDPEPWRGRIDILCGGFPCQDLSIAGQRAGLAGDQSGLFFEFLRIAAGAIDPGGFVLVENVAGLLASHKGRDFAIVLASLAELGFCDIAWRVLDSHYFGVPQRRRRVFVLGRRGSGRSCAKVLLEAEGGGGDFAASGEAPAAASNGAQDGVGSYWVEDFRNGTLTSDPGRTDRKPIVFTADDAYGVRTATGVPGRLDDPPPDGARYAAAGDAVTVNVATWIGWRLAGFERGEFDGE